MNLLEKHYSFVKSKPYNDIDDNSLDSIFVNIKMGTLYPTLTLLAFSRINFESNMNTVLAVLALTLFGLFSGVLPITLGIKNAYSIIKRMLKSHNYKLNKLHSFFM